MRLHLAIAVLICFLRTGEVYAAPATGVFVLEDHLKHAWQHELVFFPVENDLYGREDLTLLGPDGRALVHQWVPAARAPQGKNSIAFLASVGATGKSMYRLAPGTPEKATDLRVAPSPGAVQMENGRVAIRLGGPDATKEGPIAAIRLPSGRWVAGGQLTTPWPASELSCTILDQGPLLADVLVLYEFPQSCSWRLLFRMIAGEPVVLVHEEFNLPEGASYSLLLGRGWGPDRMFHRGMVHESTVTPLGAAAGQRLFLLEPWSPWWGDIPRGNWTSLFRDDGDDLLMIGCREPGVWVEPGRTSWDTSLVLANPDAAVTFQLRGFARRWMLGTLTKAESITVKDSYAPAPQQLLMRHNDVALDLIKDYGVRWDDRSTRHPRLLLTAAEAERFREDFKADPPTLQRLRQAKVNPWQMDDAVAYLVATRDEELGRRFIEAALEMLQGAVERFTLQGDLRTHGTAPHHRTFEVMCSAILADLVLGSPALKPEERERINAQLAYLGYTLASPGFISPERGYSANPNMTTSARGMLGMVACTIPSHPTARQWAKIATDEIGRQLDEWCDAEGGWLEAPHYMTVSMDAIVGLALALRESGLTDTAWEFHPKLRKAAQWLAKISTPPDPRLEGNRRMPEIGNTYLGERTCLAGWMARIWRQKDPEFAARMQWMWEAQGKPRTLGIGGAYPTTQGYGFVMFDETIPVVPPAWTSQVFPETGAVFRAHFPGRRETYLHYIQGRMHQHYDYDEGSFILWGKGAPLCEDFGYYGRAAAADHSRVDDGFVEQLGNEGRIQEFVTGGADYLRGQRAGWCRQILFVKDDDPLGPNYFVIRDSVTGSRQFDWRIWTAAAEPPSIASNPIRIKGRFEADLAVFFIDPAGPQVTTQPLTRRSGASGFNTQETTQHGLLLSSTSDRSVAVVLYPLLKDQSTPRFTALADGRGVKIETPFGIDYALLALESFRHQGEGIDFDGKAGAVAIRPNDVRISLPCRGRLSCRGKTAETPEKGGAL